MKKILMLLAALLLILGISYVGYDYLSVKISPENVLNESKTEARDSQNTKKMSEDNSDDASKDTETPDFEVLDDEGKSVRLSDFYGKPIIVNFWASWCSPCRGELPAFNDAYNTYGDEITFMMVNLTDGTRDSVDGVKAFVSAKEYDFPVYYDTELDAAYAYSISSIPMTLFIDSKGKITDKRIGAINESLLQEEIDYLLKN